MHGFLVESALLTHGLASISDEELRKAWHFAEQNIAWVEEGKIKIGGMQQFLPFRNRKNNLHRIDCCLLPTALSQGLTGALTASGTMAVCKGLGIKLAVTCGMGGIGDIEAEKLCPDLPALAEIPVALLSSGPKDMLDIPATLHWLAAHGITVYCIDKPCYTGYIFKSINVPVQQAKLADIVPGQKQGLLLINPIADENKIADLAMLQAGIAAGKQAEAAGKHYHPAANREFDRLSKGYSSKMQLDALINNVEMAQKLVADINQA